MSASRFRRALLPAALLAATAALPAFAANSNPDAHLYTSYVFDQALDTASYVVCGSVPGTGGCYGSGQFTGLGNIGAMIEGNPVVDAATGTVTRDVYVVDQAAGGGKSTTVNLVVYRLKTVVAPPNATITSTKLKTLTLPLTGGLNAHTYLAANAGYLFIGTDQGGSAVRVAKNGYATTAVAGFTPSIAVSSITADNYGYVDVTFGSLNGADGVHAYGPDGASLGLNRWASFKLGSGQGLSTFGVLAHQGSAAPARVQYHAPLAVATAANTNPDAGLSTDFSFDPAFQNVTYNVCGALSAASGCFANGTIGGFGHVGAVVLGNPNVDAAHATVRRDLFVVDDAVGGGSSTTVGLYVYRIVEAIGTSNVTVTVSKIKSLGIAVVGGTRAKIYLVGNTNVLFIGSNQSEAVVSVSKADWSVLGGGGGATPPTMSMLTTDHYDNIAATWGGVSGNDSNAEYDANGHGLGDGGGAWFMLGTVQGLSLSEVDTSVTPFAAGTRPGHAASRPAK